MARRAGIVRRRRRAAAAALVVLGGAALVLWALPGRPVSWGALVGAAAEPDSLTSPGLELERTRLRTGSGRELSCLVRRPAAASPGALPALLVAGGRRTGRRAALYVDPGFAGVVLACDYPWADLVRRRGLAFALRLPRIRAEILATPRVLALQADYLASRPDVDTARLAAVGASLGVPPVAAWAARDGRPKAVALLYGGAELGRILEANLSEDISWRWLRRPVAWVLGRALAPLEPSRTVGRIAPRPLLVIGAADDQWIPRRSVESMYAEAREPKRLVWFGGEHLRTSNEELIRALTDTTLAWLAGALR